MVRALIMHNSNSIFLAFTVKIQTFLIGSRPISKSHYITAVLGQKQETTEKRMKSEWNIVLESDQLEEKLVLKGNLESPVLSVWDLPEIRNSLIDVRFFQTLQVYRTGIQQPQWSIDVRGNTKVLVHIIKLHVCIHFITQFNCH